jgi:voltage-gated potassium channel
MEPVITDWRERTRVLAAAMIVVINLGVFFVIFDQRWERWLAFLLVALVLATGIAHQTEPNWVQFAAIAYHALAVLFFGFAVAVILKRIFQQETIRTDAVIGAICGYLLAAAAWGNAYALIYLVRPGSFRVAEMTAWQLNNWDFQRFLFSYFSITTLTGLGFGNIIPVEPVALSLSWLEAVFGQFYIAVVVAQLVGLRLAQAIKQHRPDAK